MSATEVTIGQFKKFAAATGYVTAAEKAAGGGGDQTAAAAGAGRSPSGGVRTYLNPGFAVTDDFPATMITWHDAVAFCAWLSEQEGIVYRLPTEAEWEYACRAGTTSQYSFGDDETMTDQYGWCRDNSGDVLHPPGMKRPNPFGLFDMHGNLNEWCHDSYDGTFYRRSPSNRPVGPPGGASRVLRGGGWNHFVSSLRSATRDNLAPTTYHPHVGIRCVSE